MMFAGRRILMTTLDPIPRNMRAAPGCIALRQDELDALNRLDGEKFKEIIDIVKAEDWADALLQMRPKPMKRPKHTSPSTRLAMLGAVYRKV
jgi:hypothetical protein